MNEYEFVTCPFSFVKMNIYTESQTDTHGEKPRTTIIQRQTNNQNLKDTKKKEKKK